MGRARRWERPPGFADLETFLGDFEAGRIPRKPAYERLAREFERVRSGELDPRDLDKALGLRREGPGRPPKRPASLRGVTDLRELVAPTSRLVWDELERDAKKPGALERALNAASERSGKGRRTVERKWKDDRFWYERAKEWKQQAEHLVEQNPAAFAAMKAFSRAMAPILATTAPLRATMALVRARMQAHKGWPKAVESTTHAPPRHDKK